MNGNPALGLVVGLCFSFSKCLIVEDATKVAMISAIAPFPMGVVLASVLADRETEEAAGARATAVLGTSTGTGTTAQPPAPSPSPTPAPAKPPRPDPAVVLSSEFAKLQASATQLAEHESQLAVDTTLECLVDEIREARRRIEAQNRAALQRDREAREEVAESEATQKREEAAEQKRASTKPASGS